MTVLARDFTAVCSSETLLTYCERQKQFFCSRAMSLSETSSRPLLGYSNFLRVTHPDVVVIGLLCVDRVPQGSGFTNRCCGSRRRGVKTTKKNNGWTERVHREPFPPLMYKLFHVCFMNYSRQSSFVSLKTKTMETKKLGEKMVSV